MVSLFCTIWSFLLWTTRAASQNSIVPQSVQGKFPFIGTNPFSVNSDSLRLSTYGSSLTTSVKLSEFEIASLLQVVFLEVNILYLIVALLVSFERPSREVSYAGLINDGSYQGVS